MINVPANPTTTARVKIAATGNIFFDISNANFTIVNFTCPTITIDPSTLPDGEVAQAYNQTLTASGGTAPYTYTVTTGSLPSNLTLSPSGVISGTPDTPGTSNFTATAVDTKRFAHGTKAYSIRHQRRLLLSFL